MLTFIPLLVAGILIAIGLFLIIWGKVTLRPGRRKVMDSQGHMRNSFSLRATRGLGLIFILGGVHTILGVFHLFVGALRSEVRRVGKECGSTCRSRGSPDH